MPRAIRINLEEVEQNLERVKIKYGNKEVVCKMYSIKKASLERWLRIMSDHPEFSNGVLHPTHKIVLIELDVFDDFVRWMDRTRYRRR